MSKFLSISIFFLACFSVKGQYNKQILRDAPDKLECDSLIKLKIKSNFYYVAIPKTETNDGTALVCSLGIENVFGENTNCSQFNFQKFFFFYGDEMIVKNSKGIPPWGYGEFKNQAPDVIVAEFKNKKGKYAYLKSDGPFINSYAKTGKDGYLLPGVDGEGCICRDYDFEEDYEAYSLIFSGKCIGSRDTVIVTSDNDSVPLRKNIIFLFEVINNFKGIEKRYEILDSPSRPECRYYFPTGHKFLVYASSLKSGKYYTSKCHRTKFLNKAEMDIKLIKEKLNINE